MKNNKKKSDDFSASTKPQRVLLHMAEKDGDWSGKATSFSDEEQYIFSGLDDLCKWLNDRRESKDKKAIFQISANILGVNMKILHLILILLMAVWLFLSCSKNSTGPAENYAPAVPAIDAAIGSPAHNANGQSITPLLRWTCSDPDNDPLTYDVYLGTASNPPLVSEAQSGTSYQASGLSYNTTYYWKIRARDNQGNTTNSQVWQFQTISNTPTLYVNKTSIDFSTNQVLIKLEIKNNGTGSLTWNLTDDKDWLSVSPSSGSTTTETDTVSISINRTGLSSGDYTGQINIVSNGGSAVVAAAMSVPGSATLSVSEENLNFGSNQTVLTFDISNSGPGSVSWSVNADKSWISLNPLSGSVTTETDPVTVTIDKSGLESGLYNGTISISSDAGNANISVSMEVVANATVAVSVSPETSTVELSQIKQFTAIVTNTDNPDVSWSIEPATGAGTISATGLYTAPSVLPSPATAQIKATSLADPTKSSSATVTIISTTGIANKEKNLCAQTFGGAFDAAGLAEDANEIGVQAVFLANNYTGTLTQVAGNSDQFNYSSSPSDKLVIVFANGATMEYKFNTFSGYTEGTWEEFLNDYYHTLDYSLIIDTTANLNIHSETKPGDQSPFKIGSIMKTAAYNVKFQILISGTLYYQGEKLTLDLENAGSNNGYVESGFSSNKTVETCIGTISSPTASITVSESYWTTLLHNSSEGRIVRNFAIQNNSSAILDGITYRFQDAYAKWECQSGMPGEYAPTIMNIVTEPYYWEYSGALYKDGVLYGNVIFDGPVIYESHGPELILRLTNGEDYFLHTLIQYP